MRQAQIIAALTLALLAGCSSTPATAPIVTPAVASAPSPTAAETARAPLATAAAAPTGETPPGTAVPLLPSPIVAPLIVAADDMLLPPTPAAALPTPIAAFSGDALLISPSEQDRFLRLAAPDGSRFLWLTADNTICGYANTSMVQEGRWSHDGRYIAINCEDTPSHETARLSILDTQSGQPWLVDPHSEMTSIVWSPAAPMLVSTRRPSGENDRYELVLVDAARATTRRLLTFTSEGGSTFGVAWSPDGSHIAVYGREEGRPRQVLYLLSADGSATERLDLGDAPAFYCFNGPLAWHSDGRALLLNRQFQRSATRFTLQAVRYDTATQKLDVIADDMPEAAQFRPSPDGAWYAVGLPQPDSNGLHWMLYRADGATIRDLSPDAGRDTVDLAWLPDSSALVLATVRSGFGTEILEAEPTGAARVIAGFPGAVAISSSLRISPRGNLAAVGIVGYQSVIFDFQGGMRKVLQARVWGWRPAQ